MNAIVCQQLREL